MPSGEDNQSIPVESSTAAPYNWIEELKKEIDRTHQELPTVTDHKFIDPKCHQDGCQTLVLQHKIEELLKTLSELETIINSKSPQQYEADGTRSTLPQMLNHLIEFYETYRDALRSERDGLRTITNRLRDQIRRLNEESWHAQNVRENHEAALLHWRRAFDEKVRELKDVQERFEVYQKHYEKLARKYTRRIRTKHMLNQAITALRNIYKHEGKVCKDFETCGHVECNSSVNAWMEAEEALHRMGVKKPE